MSTSTAESTHGLAPGTIVAGKYRIERTIAAGGMGVVLAAKHGTLGNPVAIKVMLPAAVAAEGAQDRFLREARAAAHLTSEHVVRVFDVGTLESGLPYMVMEHLVGSDLADVLEKRGPLPVAKAAGYVVQALEGLVEAHHQGIVHRDLKPSNLFVVERTGRVKILDFGISKLMSPDGPISAADAVRTSTRTIMGSPMYMSPELVKSAKNVDRSADIWATGAILYELLTGKTLWSGESFGEIFAQILQDPIPSVTAARPEVPEGLAAVIERCLRREREKRPTAEELMGMLAPFASDAAMGAMGPNSAANGAASRDAESRRVAQARTIAAHAGDDGGSTPAGGAVKSAGSGGAGSGRAPTMIALGALAVAVAVAAYFAGRGDGTGGGSGAVGASAQQEPTGRATAAVSSGPAASVVVSPSGPASGEPASSQGASGTAAPAGSATASAPAGSASTAAVPGGSLSGTKTRPAGTGSSGKPPRTINLDVRD